jgi:DNA-binding XRE family transcriptional regulator
MLHCTRQTIANWEGGKSIPSILETCLLCKVLNTELDELFYIIELT